MTNTWKTIILRLYEKGLHGENRKNLEILGMGKVQPGVSKYFFLFEFFVFLNLFCWFSRVLAMFLAFSVRPFPTAWPFGVTRREEHIEEAVGGSSWGVCDHTYVYIILPGRALATLAQVAARPTQEAESVHDTRHSGNSCRGSRPAFGPSLWPQVIMMQPCATRSINQSG